MLLFLCSWLTRPCDLQLHRQEVVNGVSGMRWAETGTPSAVTIKTPPGREEIISISCFAFHLSIRWWNTTKHKTGTNTFTCKRLSSLAYLKSKKKLAYLFSYRLFRLILFQPCSVWISFIIISDIFPPKRVIILWSLTWGNFVHSKQATCMKTEGKLRFWKKRRDLLETKINIYPCKIIALLIKRVRRENNTIDLPRWLEHSEK